MIALKADFPNPLEQTQLEEFSEIVRDRFPVKEAFNEFHSELIIGNLGATEVSAPVVRAFGLYLRSTSGTRVVTVRSDGFGFSHLKPYDRWEALRDEFTELWSLFVGVSGARSVTRIGVRYINKLNLPLPCDFNDYLRTVPEIAPELPQGLASFMMRLVIPVDEIPAVAILTQAYDTPSVESSIAPVIFDIDTFREGRFDPASDDLFRTLEHLRDLKNRLFFSSITDKTKDMYEPGSS